MIPFLQGLFLYTVPFLFVLTVVVTIHELGHFLVARWCKVKIDRFSVGFGRAILSRTDKTGVEWRLGWIPLGGYVKFAGDGDISSSVPDEGDLDALRRAIIAQDGPGSERTYFHFKPLWQRAAVILAGPVANFLLSIVLFAVLMMAVGETVLAPRIGSVVPNTPAARAGFQPGDMILSADGRAIGDFRELTQYNALRAGEAIRFVVLRQGNSLPITATPERRMVTDNLSHSAHRIGLLGLGSSLDPRDVSHHRFGPVEALTGGVARTWDVLDTTLFYMGRVFKGHESGDQLGGFIGIAQTSGQVAQAGAAGAPDLAGKILGSITALTGLIAVISVGIGFLNLLPVPVLDGGHLLFYAYEAAARRPLGAKVQAAGYRLGLAMLLALMLFAAWNDLQKLSVFKILGGHFS